MTTWPFVTPESDLYRRKSRIDRHALSSYTKLVLMLAGFRTDNARSEALGADEGEPYRCGCAVVRRTLRGGRSGQRKGREGEDNVGLAQLWLRGEATSAAIQWNEASAVHYLSALVA